MGIYLLLLPIIVVLVGGLFLVLRGKPGRTSYSGDDTNTSTKKKIDDLHKMQTHKFWRDFDR